MHDFSIREKFQSGFKHQYTTETDLLRVLHNLLLTADSGNSVVLVLLDLTAASDTVNHLILLFRLEKCVGINGTALEWLKSSLSNRIYSAQLGEFSSSSPRLCFRLFTVFVI